MTIKEAKEIIGHYDVNFYYISGEHESEKIPADKLIDAFDIADRAIMAVEKIYSFIMKSEASETTDGVLDVLDNIPELEVDYKKAKMNNDE